MINKSKTLFEKIWQDHIIEDLSNNYFLLHVDRNIMHDLLGSLVFEPLDNRKIKMPNPELSFSTMDHGIDTNPGRTDKTKIPGGEAGVRGLRKKSKEYGINLFDLEDRRQGIVHVITPELGIALPGSLLICGDSHTSTIGGMGALAWGAGLTEIEHILATQTIVSQKPKSMRINFSGLLKEGVTAKDMILYLIKKIGAKSGNGHVVEYSGEVIKSMSIESRLTVSNMAIEMAAKYGLIAADDTTFDYLYQKEFSPKDSLWDEAVKYWRKLPSDEDAIFDKEFNIDISNIGPHVTWGTSPQDAIDISDKIPDPKNFSTLEEKEYINRALEYVDLKPGQFLIDTPIDVAFIGSCTNARLSDLERASKVVRGRKVSDSVSAWVVPGSMQVKQDAEAKGIDKIFKSAGFEWREPGCSMCVALGGDKFPPGSRSISSTNRNFENRQGVGVRTHLASPEMVAAAAIEGKIIDVRKLINK
ncbi:3-isopropylmalate dehydratase large subunit [Alphaproteobacteria bacterium]|nr:3-isopropylmalate dehydratase large subunit [Alphaproteobacteria bacterium]